MAPDHPAAFFPGLWPPARRCDTALTTGAPVLSLWGRGTGGRVGDRQTGRGMGSKVGTGSGVGAAGGVGDTNTVPGQVTWEATDQRPLWPRASPSGSLQLPASTRWFRGELTLTLTLTPSRLCFLFQNIEQITQGDGTRSPSWKLALGIGEVILVGEVLSSYATGRLPSIALGSPRYGPAPGNTSMLLHVRERVCACAWAKGGRERDGEGTHRSDRTQTLPQEISGGLNFELILVKDVVC